VVKTEYMVMSLDQNAGRRHRIKNNSSFERMEQFRYLGMTLTDQNSVHGGIKSRWKARNSCYDAEQNLMSSVCSSNIYRSRYTKM
jgi:hypothetical protein